MYESFNLQIVNIYYLPSTILWRRITDISSLKFKELNNKNEEFSSNSEIVEEFCQYKSFLRSWLNKMIKKMIFLLSIKYLVN